MAIYLLRALLERAGGAPRDRVVMGWHVEAGDQPTASGWYSALATSWSSVQAVIQTNYEVDRLQVYNADVGGAPVDEVAGDPVDFPTSGAEGPTEVQVAVSRWTNDQLGRARKHGRIYVGPIAGGFIQFSRPQAAFRTALADWAADLHDLLVVSGVGQPVVASRLGGGLTAYPIVQYSVDDAWDTQRRRGLDPTIESVAIPEEGVGL